MRTALFFLAISTAALGACKTPGTVVETQYKVVTVSRAGPCPDAETYQRIIASRPKPLRERPEPAEAVARVAQIVAQLGLFEGAGGWADQVQAVLDRCQSTAEPERVAPSQ